MAGLLSWLAAVSQPSGGLVGVGRVLAQLWMFVDNETLTFEERNGPLEDRLTKPYSNGGGGGLGSQPWRYRGAFLLLSCLASLKPIRRRHSRGCRERSGRKKRRKTDVQRGCSSIYASLIHILPTHEWYLSEWSAWGASRKQMHRPASMTVELDHGNPPSHLIRYGMYKRLTRRVSRQGCDLDASHARPSTLPNPSFSCLVIFLLAGSPHVTFPNKEVLQPRLGANSLPPKRSRN